MHADPLTSATTTQPARRRTVLPALGVVLTLVLGACSSEGSDAETTSRGVDDTTTTTEATSGEDDDGEDDGEVSGTEAPEPDPRCEPGDGYTVTDLGTTVIPATEIPATELPSVEIDGRTIGGGAIPAARIDPVEFHNGCIIEWDAPGGCLGRVLITGVEIPGAEIPGAEIPPVREGPFDIDPVPIPGRSVEGASTGDVETPEVCRVETEGRAIPAVARPAVARRAVARPAVARPAVSRPTTCTDDRVCLDGTYVDAAYVDQVYVDQAYVDAGYLDAVYLDEVTVDDVDVYADDDETAYTTSGDVLFDFDEDELRPDAASALREIAESIDQRFADRTVRVDGHTDSVGDDDHNQDLSERRARAVADWLTTEGGIDPSRVTVTGHGARAPVAPNERPDGSDDPDGRQQNRRVVITAGG